MNNTVKVLALKGLTFWRGQESPENNGKKRLAKIIRDISEIELTDLITYYMWDGVCHK